MNIIKERRVGRFGFDWNLGSSDPDLMIEVMKGSIIVSAEHQVWANQMAYVAYNAAFAPIEQWQAIPEYYVDVEITPDGPRFIGFKTAP